MDSLPRLPEEQPEWMLVNVRGWVEKRFDLSDFYVRLPAPFRLSDRSSQGHYDYEPWVPNGYWIGSIATEDPSENHCLVMQRRSIV